eukprot:3638879-Amphidinium_carterae.1
MADYDFAQLNGSLGQAALFELCIAVLACAVASNRRVDRCSGVCSFNVEQGLRLHSGAAPHEFQATASRMLLEMPDTRTWDMSLHCLRRLSTLPAYSPHTNYYLIYSKNKF